MKRAVRPVLGLSMFLLSLSLSCDEQLPLYAEPNFIFEASLSGFYAHSLSDNSLKIYLTVKNIYHETFQEEALLQGELLVTSVRDSALQRRFTLSFAEVIEGPGYNRRTGVLTMEPGATVRLGVSWDFVDDRGKDLRYDFFEYVEDPACPSRCLAMPEEFIAKAFVLLYDRTGQVSAPPISLPVCYVFAYVGSPCSSAITIPPCNDRWSLTGRVCRPQRGA